MTQWLALCLALPHRTGSGGRVSACEVGRGGRMRRRPPRLRKSLPPRGRGAARRRPCPRGRTAAGRRARHLAEPGSAEPRGGVALQALLLALRHLLLRADRAVATVLQQRQHPNNARRFRLSRGHWLTRTAASDLERNGWQHSAGQSSTAHVFVTVSARSPRWGPRGEGSLPSLPSVAPSFSPTGAKSVTIQS